MPLALEISLLLLASALAAPSIFLAIQCLLAWALGEGERDTSPFDEPVADPDAEDARVVVVIPAHNEERVIAETLASVVAQLASPADALVVADNCADATADVARSFGATVVERFDSVRRGKGFALDCAVRHLERNPPAVVAVLDADCRLYPGSIAAFRERVSKTGRPQQGVNLSDAAPAANPQQAIALFANRVVNLIRPAASAAIGMPCRLLGTGMAFPWETIRDAPLATGDLVEDMRLGVDLTIAGASPQFCSKARVTTELPGCERSFRSQRTRWEHGHLAAATKQVPRLALEALRQRRPELAYAALDLAVPPLSLLCVVSCVAWVLLIAAVLWNGTGLAAFSLLSCAGVAAAGGLALAWRRFCRKQIPLASLARTPIYVAAKLPIYASMIVRRQKIWVRTERGPA